MSFDIGSTNHTTTTINAITTTTANCTTDENNSKIVVVLLKVEVIIRNVTLLTLTYSYITLGSD